MVDPLLIALADDNARIMKSWGEEVTALTNSRDHYKQLWDDSCKAVAELCELAGMPEGAAPDLWTLKAQIEEMRAALDYITRLHQFAADREDWLETAQRVAKRALGSQKQ